MLRNSKRYIQRGIIAAATFTCLLHAAGSYQEPSYGNFDITPPAHDVQYKVGDLTLERNVFSGALPEQNSAVGYIGTGNTTLKMSYPAAYNYMSSESNANIIRYNSVSDNYYKNPADYIHNGYELTEAAPAHRLLPGYAATQLNKEGAESAFSMIYDIYPGKAAIINNDEDDIRISFRVFSRHNGNDVYESPYLKIGGTQIIITIDDGAASVYTVFRNSSTNKFEINGPAGADWYGDVVDNLNDGNAYGVYLKYGQSMASGTKVRVQIKSQNTLTSIWENVSLSFLVEGVPFLERIITNQTEEISKDRNSVTLNSQLYGWTADGGQDINGDGFPDLVVGDPYYKYSNDALDGVRTGRVYVYFGGPGKILDAHVNPDIVIENASPTPNYKYTSSDREFGYKVKLGDINGDGYADIIVGHPSYAGNKGRILIYYGGPQFSNGALGMNISRFENTVAMMSTPSIVIVSDRADDNSNNPDLADVFGAVFDVADFDQDGQADIVAKIGNNPEKIKNFVYLMGGKQIEAAAKEGKVYNYRLYPYTRSVTLFGQTGLNVLQASEVAAIGDFNRDGYPDFAVSFPEAGTGSDVKIFYGDINAGEVTHLASYRETNYGARLMDSSENNHYFGMSIAGADINGDGYSDVVVGKLTTEENSQTGKALIFLGRPGSNINIVYDGLANPAYGGIIAINDPLLRNAVNGSSLSKRTQFGLRVANVGSLNGDRFEDIMIGAPYYGDSEIGAVYLIMGAELPDTFIGEDNLRAYVITGKFANAHYGLNMVSIGDFSQNGVDDVLLAAPGFSGSEFFAGYSLPLAGKNSIDRHSFDVYSNIWSADHTLPGVMVGPLFKDSGVLSPLFDSRMTWDEASQTYTYEGGVGWDENSDSLNIVVYDRGSAGLEFNSFSLDFLNRGDDSLVRKLLLGKKETKVQSVYDGNYSFNLWVSENEMYKSGQTAWGSQYTLNDYNKDGNPFNTRITQGDGDSQKLRYYERDPAFIRLNMALLNKNNAVLKPGNEYILRLRASDRGGLTYLSEFSDEQQVTVHINFVSNEKPMAAVNVSATDGPKKTAYTAVLDLDNNGVPEFVVGEPKDNRVIIYWGAAGQNFDGNDILKRTIIPNPNTSSIKNFGKTIAAAVLPNRVGDGVVNSLLIGDDTGFYIVQNPLPVADYNIANIGPDFRVRLAADNTAGVNIISAAGIDKVGQIMTVKNDRSAVTSNKDVIAILSDDGKKIATIYYYTNSLTDVSVSKPSGLSATRAVNIAAGNVISNTGLQQLIVGDPGVNSVYVYSAKINSSSPYLTWENKATIVSSLTGGGFGSSLAAGYFDSVLGRDGKSASGNLQNLAIGAPNAAINGTTSNGFVLVTKPGKLESQFNNKPIHTVPTENYYLLTGEQTGSQFGHSLVSLKYMATPEHLSKWSVTDNGVYYDDADDLVVGAPYANGGKGKIYIYRGDGYNGLPVKPTSGYIRNDAVCNMGLVLANAGDAKDAQTDILAVSGKDGRVDLLISTVVPDTKPPTLMGVSPINSEYEVGLNSAITLNFSDISGVDTSTLMIRRRLDGHLVRLVEHGVINTSYEENGRKYFKLTVTPDNTALARDVTYVLSLDQASQWTNSEVVELEISVADGRKVYNKVEGNVRLEPSPLTTTLSYGFITEYKPNSQLGNVHPIVGKNANAYFGSAVAYAGDVNGDGFPDFIVGEYGNNEDGWMSGKAYLYLGNKNVGVFTQEAAAEFAIGLGVGANQTNSAQFGWRVAAVGDMNGDGYDDVAIVAVNSATRGGEVFILFGNPDPRVVHSNSASEAALKTESDRIYKEGPVLSKAWDNEYVNFFAASIRAAQNGDGLGAGISGGGDINGDGYADLVIGAPYFSQDGKEAVGRAYVIFGRSDMVQTYARSQHFYQVGRINYAGPIMLADVNTNLVDWPGDLDARRAGYIPNPSPNAWDMFGQAVLSDINLNGDTNVVKYMANGAEFSKVVPVSDILISAVGFGDSTGRVYVYAGRTDQKYSVAWQPDSTLSGHETGEKFGFSLANIGDVNADNNQGKDPAAKIGQDFVVGAPGSGGARIVGNDIRRPYTGAAYLYLSKPGDTPAFKITQALDVYGQRAGDQFGYAVSNVGNISNDIYGNNSFAVGAPFFSNLNYTKDTIVTRNAGRVYMFTTSLENIGTDHSPKYIESLSKYPSQISTGTFANEFFGAEISYLGDVDNDFIPEYLVGAPGNWTGAGAGEGSGDLSSVNLSGSNALMGNRGRVYLYSNLDTVSPQIYEPMAGYMYPVPGDEKAELVTIFEEYVGGVTVSVQNYEATKMKFRMIDDRAVKLDSVVLELDPQGKNHVSKYVFLPSVDGERYYTYNNRRSADFYLNLRSNYYHNTTYNVRIYATDMAGNPLHYWYGDLGYAPFIPVADRSPAKSMVPRPLEEVLGATEVNNSIRDNNGKVRPYFEYAFHTVKNPLGTPDIEKFALLSTSPPNVEEYDYFTDKADFSLMLQSSSIWPMGWVYVASSPNILQVSNQSADAVKFDFNTTLNSNTINWDKGNLMFFLNNDAKDSAVSVSIGAIDGIPTKDGRFVLTLYAADDRGHAMEPFSRTFIKDVAPPVVVPLSPLAGTNDNPDDCSINFRLVDEGTGLNILSGNVIDLSLLRVKYSVNSTSVWLDVPTNAIAVQAYDKAIEDVYGAMVTISEQLRTFLYGENDEMLGLVSVDITIKLKDPFAYEDIVRLKVFVTDNAGRGAAHEYSYQVSPDYRPPRIPYGYDPLIHEGEFTLGQLTISVNAIDDIGVARVIVDVQEDPTDAKIQNTTGLALVSSNANSASRSIGVAVNPPAPNYNSLIKVYMKPVTGNGYAPDGLRYIRVWYEDAQGNRSAQSVTLSIKINAESKMGGPVMPIVRVNYTGQPVPDYRNIPLYFNKDAAMVDLFVYALDTKVSPDMGSQSPSMMLSNGNVLGVIVSTLPSPNATKVNTNVNNSRLLNRLLPYWDAFEYLGIDSKPQHPVEPLALDPYVEGREMTRIPSFNLSEYDEGAIKLYVRFVDNDAGLALRDETNQDGLKTSIYDYLFGINNEALSATNPTANANHPINSLASRNLLPVSTNNTSRLYPYNTSVNYSDNCAELTIYYDLTPPRIHGLAAFGGRTKTGGANWQYNAWSYSRDKNHLQFRVDYADSYHDTRLNNLEVEVPVKHIYYQIVGVSKDASASEIKKIYVDTKGSSNFWDESDTDKVDYKRDGAYTAYDGQTVFEAGQWIYAAPPESVTGSGELKVSGDELTSDRFVTDNFAARYMTESNLRNWTRLDVSANALKKTAAATFNTLHVELPVSLNADEMYYLRVCIVDQAGNFSEIQNSNYVYLDEGDGIGDPQNPQFNYNASIKLNRNRFDLDFFDTDSGLFDIRYRLNAGADTLFRPIYLNTTATANAQPINEHMLTQLYKYNDEFQMKDFTNELTANWKILQAVWDSLPEDETQYIHFELTDAVGNIRNTAQRADGVAFQFSKKSKALPLITGLESPTGIKNFAGGKFTQDKVVTLNVQPAEPHYLILTDVPYEEVVAVNSVHDGQYYDDNYFIKDFSFEYQGDQGIYESQYVTLTDSALRLKSSKYTGQTTRLAPSQDARVDSEIVLLEASEYSRRFYDHYFQGKSTMGANGNYALAVSFNVTINADLKNFDDFNNDDYSYYTWGGLIATFNAPLLRVTRNYTVGVLLDMSTRWDDSEPFLISKQGTGSNPPGFIGLVVSTNTERRVADERMDVIESGTGPSWKLLTANITIAANASTADRQVTINIAHLYNTDSDSDTYREFCTPNTPYRIPLGGSKGMIGLLLVDALTVVPGEAVTPAIYVSNNATAMDYAFQYATVLGGNSYTVLSYDQLGNLVTASERVTADHTPPTWNTIPGQIELAVTRSERAPHDTPDTRYIAYYLIEPSAAFAGAAYRLMSNVSEDVTETGGLGRLYTNALSDHGGYIRGYFMAQDLESPINLYQYRIYKYDIAKQFDEGTPVDLDRTDRRDHRNYDLVGTTLAKAANNKDILSTVYDVYIDALIPQADRGGSYYMAVQAQNIFGMKSEWVSSDILFIDVDPPTISYQIEPSMLVTMSSIDKESGEVTETAQEAGWYRDTIHVTINAYDWQFIGEGLVTDNYELGGVGVKYIYVVTNNNTSRDVMPYDVEDQPSRNKVITFELNEEGANVFQVYATDKLGHMSKILARNTGLWIDRKPPVVDIPVEDNGYNGHLARMLTTEIENPNWQTIDRVYFGVRYSDGDGVGTAKLMWEIDGNPQPDFLLDRNPIGSYMHYRKDDFISQDNPVSLSSLTLMEGLKGGAVAKDVLNLSPALKSALVAKAPYFVLGEYPGESEFARDYYQWNSANNDGPTFVNDRDLYEILSNKSIVGVLPEEEIFRLVNAWRFNTRVTGNGARQVHYQYLNHADFAFAKDGYHSVSVSVVDKFGYASPAVTMGIVAIDRGQPDIQVDLGGSFQSVWSLHDIAIKADLFDTFKDEVWVTESYYPDYMHDYLRDLPYYGLAVKAIGSGVDRVVFGMGTGAVTSSESIQKWVTFNVSEMGDKELPGRFGFSINKGYTLDGNKLNPNYERSLPKDKIEEELVITTNGINFITYQVWDKAGNTQTFDISQSEGQWYEELGSYVYDGDRNVIRGIKVDTLPPYALGLDLVDYDDPSGDVRVKNSYTDTRPDLADYPLYTNKRDISVRFYGKDDGIGVRYGYFSATENVATIDPMTLEPVVDGSAGIVSMPGNKAAYVDKVDEWLNLTQEHFTDAFPPISKEQGILVYSNYRQLRLGETQGTRNLTMRMADDFGLDYLVSKASVEQTSSVFKYLKTVPTLNNEGVTIDIQVEEIAPPDYVSANLASLAVTYLPIAYRDTWQASQNETWGLVTADSGSYFVWEGIYSVPSANKNLPFGKDIMPGGYTVAEKVINKETGESIRIYQWQVTMDGHLEHRSETITADRLIVYDNIVSPSTVLGDELDIREFKYDGAARYINSDIITIPYRHLETDELSGITDIMFSGDVQAVYLSTEPTRSISANNWVHYTYRSKGATNDYKITLLTPAGAEDGDLTVNITALRDRAGNILNGDGSTADMAGQRYSGQPMHTVSFRYDRPIPRDKVESRYVIKTDAGLILNGKYFVGVPTYNIELDFGGARYYEVLEYIEATGLENSLVSGDYTELPGLDGKNGWRLVSGVTLSADNKADGAKTLLIRLFDITTANTPANALTITYNHYVDNTPPTFNLTGLESASSSWYIPSVTFNLAVTDNGSGIASIVYQINNNRAVTLNFNYDNRASYPKEHTLANILINETGHANSLNITLVDGVGNTTKHKVTGIRINANPPQLVDEYGIRPQDGKVEGRRIYVNTRDPRLKITAYGTTKVRLSGAIDDYDSSTNTNYPSNDGFYTIKLSENNGTRNLKIEATDEMTGYGGPSSVQTIELALDTVAPEFAVNTAFTREITVVSTAGNNPTAITGNINDPERNEYASGAEVYYTINGVKGVFQAVKNGGTWLVKIGDVLRLSERNSGRFILEFYAEDKAGNRNADGNKTVEFRLSPKYILAADSLAINNANITNVDSEDNRVRIANHKLRGVIEAPELSDTMADFMVQDANGNAVHLLSAEAAASGNTKIVIRYSDAAAQKYKPETFRIYVLNETTAEWELVPGEQIVNKDSKTVEVAVQHFSVYRIFAQTTFASDLKDVHTYPNPYKGSDDNVYNGDDNDPDYDKVSIENITETSKIRIYTISGELVRTLDPEAGKTVLLWDLTNNRGQKVASGIYIILVTDDDHNKFIGRLTVVR